MIRWGAILVPILFVAFFCTLLMLQKPAEIQPSAYALEKGEADLFRLEVEAREVIGLSAGDQLKLIFRRKNNRTDRVQVPAELVSLESTEEGKTFDLYLKAKRTGEVDLERLINDDPEILVTAPARSYYSILFE